MADQINIESPLARTFLRDAVAILPDNRRDLPERLGRAVFLAKKFSLNLEITLDARFFGAKDPAILEAIQKATTAFPGVAYHLHSSHDLKFGNNAHTRELVDFCRQQKEEGHLLGLCAHPDLVVDFEVFRELVSKNFYVGVEVLDEKSTSFNTMSSMDELLARHNYLSLVLDTAHIAGMENQGEPPLAKYCETFAGRIAEVHLSRPGNYYNAGQMGDLFDTDHSLLSLGDNETADSLRSLQTIDNLIMVIEGVIPAGDYGHKLLKDELKFLADNLQ